MRYRRRVGKPGLPDEPDERVLDLLSVRTTSRGRGYEVYVGWTDRRGARLLRREPAFWFEPASALRINSEGGTLFDYMVACNLKALWL